MNFPAIIIEHPHQTPAKAYIVDSFEDLLTIALHNYWRSDCSGPEPVDADTAIAYLGHDLHGITVLESAEETKTYLKRAASVNPAVRRHNPGLNVTHGKAFILGWIGGDEIKEKLTPEHD